MKILSDDEIAEALHNADFSTMVTLDDHFYICARAIEKAITNKIYPKDDWAELAQRINQLNLEAYYNGR